MLPKFDLPGLPMHLLSHPYLLLPGKLPFQGLEKGSEGSMDPPKETLLGTLWTARLQLASTALL